MLNINFLTKTRWLVTIIFLFSIAIGHMSGTQLFHETFGAGGASARAWDNSYSVKSGVSAVYSGVGNYDMTNLKQGNSNSGDGGSGGSLIQTTKGTDAVFIVGPLNVANYTSLVVTYKWKASSIKGTYTTKLYYKTSSSGSYSEVSGTGTGATTYVTRTYNLPAAAQVSTLYLKVTFNTSNTQAYIDEFDLAGTAAAPSTKTLNYLGSPAGTITGGTFVAKVGGVDVSNGGSVAPSTSVSLSSTPDTGNGYSFLSWEVYKSGDRSTQVTVTNNAFTMPSYDVVVTAHFTKYHASFSTGTGNPSVANVNADENGILTLPAGPTPACSESGWEFMGWGYSECNGSSTQPDLMAPGGRCKITANDEFYAVYVKDKAATTNYVLVSTIAEVGSDEDYVIAAYYSSGSADYAIKAASSTTNYIDRAAVTTTGDVGEIIENPASNVIWHLTWEDAYKVALYNSNSSKYLNIASSSSASLSTSKTTLILEDEEDEDPGYSNHFMLELASDATKMLVHDNSNSYYKVSTSANYADNIYIYKKQYSGSFHSNPTCSCTGYSFHYGIDGEDGWTTECFTYSAGSVYYVDDFTIPAAGTSTHFYVGKYGSFYNDGLGYSNQSRSKVRRWHDNGDDNENGEMFFAAPLDNSNKTVVVGQAAGAVGKIRINDDSDWNNLRCAFVPDGYVLKFNTSEYPFTVFSGNQYRSDLVTYNSTSALYTVSVGIVDGSGDYVATDNSPEMKHIFLNTGGTDYWSKDGVSNFGLYDVTNSKWACLMLRVPGESYLYEGWVQSNCSTVIFVRLKSSTLDWGTTYVHNQTGNLDLVSGKNIFTISSWSDGAWWAYDQKGKFRISDNTDSINWGVRFIPHYVLTYNANGGSSTMGEQSVAVDAASKVVTVSTSTFTAPQTYQHFDHWDTQYDDGGTDYDAGDDYTLSANGTLYAIWANNSYTITYKDKGGGAFSGTHATGKPTTHTYGTETTLKSASKSYNTFDGWYTNIDCTGDPVTSLGATAYTDNITLYAKWTPKVDQFIDDLQETTGYTSASPHEETGAYSMPGPLSNGDKETGNDCRKAHYKFVGWVTAGGQNTNGTIKGTPKIWQPGESNSANNQTYYAVWAEEE